MKAIRLKTEYLTNPLGIDIQAPRFFWNCEGGVFQSAYRIVCTRGGDQVWDSGKVESSAMTHIRYEGQKLRSRDRIDWTVTLWDENGVAGEAASAWFELGLLDPADWSAKWISGAYQPRKNRRYPADCFRKDFSAVGKIRSARLYATARGIYTVTINGTLLRDFHFAPGMTDYRRRIQVQTYDVTALLAEQNTLTLTLGDGWYRGSCAAYGVTQVYGAQTSVLAQLEITYEDGTTDRVGTDGSWAWSNDGPVRFNDLQDGELFDARMTPSFSGKAQEVPEPKAVLCASNNVPVTEHERFAGTELGNGVYDFGQNLAGILCFTVRGERGAVLRLRCGEKLDENGNLDQTNFQEQRPAAGWTQTALITKLVRNTVKGETAPTPMQEVVFVCSGGEDVYESDFAVFGFRYAQIEADASVSISGLTAVAVYSDMEFPGSFRCSHAGLNKLVENTRWSMKSNFLDLPTDCPTRERLGWTGDAQIFFHTAADLADTAAFFRKWLRDMADAQYKNGLLPAVLPYQGVEMMYKSTGSSAGWADAVYLIPWRHYLRYGDVSLLRECWPMMKAYADYLLKNREKDGSFQKGVQLGEWLEPVEFRDKGPGEKHPEEATAYFFLAMETMARIAEVLGEDAAAYREAGQKAKAIYKQHFSPGDTLRPSKLVRPLAFGLLEGEQIEKAAAQLDKAVQDFGCRVGTGFLSTPFLLSALAENGCAETAYRVLENEEKPGWLYEMNHGATTVWETWEGATSGENNSGSLNHYSPGAVCEFLFDTVVGIRQNGERSYIIAPLPGGTLENAEASYKSLYGEVRSAWKKSGEGITFEVTIPVNCTAELRLPDGRTEQLSAGTFCFAR